MKAPAGVAYRLLPLLRSVLVSFALSHKRVRPLAGSRFVSERLNPYTQDDSLVRKVGLDKLMERFNVESTELTLVPLFNHQP
jgi:hypothetical protein